MRFQFSSLKVSFLIEYGLKCVTMIQEDFINLMIWKKSKHHLGCYFATKQTKIKSVINSRLSLCCTARGSGTGFSAACHSDMVYKIHTTDVGLKIQCTWSSITQVMEVGFG